LRKYKKGWLNCVFIKFTKFLQTLFDLLYIDDDVVYQKYQTVTISSDLSYHMQWAISNESFLYNIFLLTLTNDQIVIIMFNRPWLMQVIILSVIIG